MMFPGWTLLLLCIAVVHADIPVVDTTSGRVAGTNARWRPNVRLYVGIPFAKPPVGDLRWKKPVRFPKSETVIQATKPPHMCMQFPWPETPESGRQDANGPIRSYNFQLEISGMRNSTMDEDCLYLNIWNKPGGSRNKAVLVWIYGGAFLWGSSHGGVYDGSVLADENDVVVVGINYRLGAFGFAMGPGIDTNVGLRDQRMALEWVRDNIHKFGGDPERITVMGQSAGAISIDLYTHAYKHDPIIKGAIAMSGSVHLIEPIRVTPYMGETKGFYAFVRDMGCGGRYTGTSAIMNCLRQIPAEEINSPRWTGTIETIGYLPYIDHELVFADYLSREATGSFANVPLLIGSTEHEMKNTFQFMHLNEPSALNGDDEHAPITLFTLFLFTCGAAMSASARTAHNVPVWMYQYAGNFSNTFFPSYGGNYHISDVPQVFGTAGYTTLIPNTPKEDAYSSWVRGAWTTFAKDPVKGLSKAPYKWPTFSNETDSLLRIGVDNAAGIVRTNPRYACALCPFIECAQSLVYKTLVPMTHHQTQLVRVYEADFEKRSLTSKLFSPKLFGLSPDPFKLMSIPPAFQLMSKPFGAYGKALRSQLLAFKNVEPGQQAPAEPIFASCRPTFPVGPLLLPSG